MIRAKIILVLSHMSRFAFSKSYFSVAKLCLCNIEKEIQLIIVTFILYTEKIFVILAVFLLHK